MELLTSLFQRVTHLKPKSPHSWRTVCGCNLSWSALGWKGYMSIECGSPQAHVFSRQPSKFASLLPTEHRASFVSGYFPANKEATWSHRAHVLFI